MSREWVNELIEPHRPAVLFFVSTGQSKKERVKYVWRLNSTSSVYQGGSL